MYSLFSATFSKGNFASPSCFTPRSATDQLASIPAPEGAPQPASAFSPHDRVQVDGPHARSSDKFIFSEFVPASPPPLPPFFIERDSAGALALPAPVSHLLRIEELPPNNALFILSCPNCWVPSECLLRLLGPILVRYGGGSCVLGGGRENNGSCCEERGPSGFTRAYKVRGRETVPEEDDEGARACIQEEVLVTIRSTDILDVHMTVLKGAQPRLTCTHYSQRINN